MLLVTAVDLTQSRGDNFKSQADLGGTAEKRNTWERVQIIILVAEWR